MITLTSEQQQAVEMVKKNPVSIISGSPGCGKTTTAKEVIKWAREEGLRFSLCSPSGKASRRLSEATGYPAQTIHKLLEARMDNSHFQFGRSEQFPINTDLILCDETSMVSSDLMASLLRAISNGTKAVFIGDPGQLPSVAPGSVLRDFIVSKKIPHTELSIIHRHSGGIVNACHQIKQGKSYTPSPTLDPDNGLNIRHIEESNPSRIVQIIKELVCNRLPLRGYDPIWNIQVLSPTNTKTDLSCLSINKVLQAELNPNPPVEGTPFRVGDKIIQTLNQRVKDKHGAEDYIVNGDLAQITDIGKKEITAMFFDPDREISLPRHDLHILLAFCVTTHRYQGSEAPVIIVPVHKSFEFFMVRSWIYTAISRASDICLTIGQFSAIEKAIARDDSDKRFTRLVEKLKEEQ